MVHKPIWQIAVEIKVDSEYKPPDHNLWLTVYDRHCYSWKELEVSPMIHEEKFDANFLTHMPHLLT